MIVPTSHELAYFGDHIASIITDGIADGSLQWRGDPSLASLTMMAMAFSLIGALVLKPPFHEVEPIPHNPDEIFACFQRFIRESLHSTVKNA